MGGIQITDLNVLFLTHKGEGYVGAPQTRHGFEQAVAKLCNCKFAGEGWMLHKPNETMAETVKRVMPDADWVIDSDNNLHNKKPIGRNYKVGHFISDLHAKHQYNVNSPIRYATFLNEVGYDSIFMRYPVIYGTENRPDAVYDLIECDKSWVPWSIDTETYTPKEKTVDVTFIGRVNKKYPLRQKIWDGLYDAALGYKIIRETSPPGKTYERLISQLNDTHLVGKRYSDALAETRIFLFGCSVYRYPLQKFFEASASGCLVMSNKPSMSKYLGFVDGKTYVNIDTGNWEEKLRWLLENPDKVRQIARSGMKNTLMNHSHQTRAEQFLEILNG